MLSQAGKSGRVISRDMVCAAARTNPRSPAGEKLRYLKIPQEMKHRQVAYTAQFQVASTDINRLDPREL